MSCVFPSFRSQFFAGRVGRDETRNSTRHRDACPTARWNFLFETNDSRLFRRTRRKSRGRSGIEWWRVSYSRYTISCSLPPFFLSLSLYLEMLFVDGKVSSLRFFLPSSRIRTNYSMSSIILKELEGFVTKILDFLISFPANFVEENLNL